jgi:hypothetical protein
MMKRTTVAGTLMFAVFVLAGFVFLVATQSAFAGTGDIGQLLSTDSIYPPVNAADISDGVGSVSVPERIAVVPVPSALLLLAPGLAGLIALRRKIKK